MTRIERVLFRNEIRSPNVNACKTAEKLSTSDNRGKSPGLEVPPSALP
jgi:hypothetical protein